MSRQRKPKNPQRRVVDDLGPLYFTREVAIENGEAVYEFRANENHPLHAVTAAVSEAHKLSAPARAALQGLLLCIEGESFRIVPQSWPYSSMWALPMEGRADCPLSRN